MATNICKVIVQRCLSQQLADGHHTGTAVVLALHCGGCSSQLAYMTIADPQLSTQFSFGACTVKLGQASMLKHSKHCLLCVVLSSSSCACIYSVRMRWIAYRWGSSSIQKLAAGVQSAFAICAGVSAVLAQPSCMLTFATPSVLLALLQHSSVACIFRPNGCMQAACSISNSRTRSAATTTCWLTQ